MCIIKSLAIAKMTYVSLCLTIPEKVIKEIDMRIFRFLWGKRDRIKRESIINEIEKGGLKMIDIRVHFNAIKAAWVPRIVNAPHDHMWSLLPKQYFSTFGNNYAIVKSTFTSLKMFPLLKRIPQFYQDVVLSYNASKVIHHEDFKNAIRNQPIWGNKFIMFRSEALFFKSWVKEGIVMIKNLKLRDGKLDINYLTNVVKDKRNFYREINILQKALNQAKVDISIDPTRDVDIPIYFHHTDEIYNWSIQRSKYFYKHLLENIAIPPTSDMYWINTTGLRVTEQHLHKSYIRKIKVIKDKKLAETNFKILNNILPCNRNLHKWRKSETNLCYFCKEEESISYLLYYCTRAKPIWDLIENVILGDDNVTHDIVIFGYDRDNVLNHLLSIIVYYIYKEWLVCSLENKQKKRMICYKSLVNYLKIRRNVYSKCEHTIWVDVCIKIDNLISHIEDVILA